MLCLLQNWMKQSIPAVYDTLVLGVQPFKAMESAKSDKHAGIDCRHLEQLCSVYVEDQKPSLASAFTGGHRCESGLSLGACQEMGMEREVEH